MKEFKKLLCLVLVIALSTVFVSGCMNNKIERLDEVERLKPNDTIEAIDFGDGNLIAKGKSIDIPADTYGYYIYQCALTEAMKDDPNLTDIANYDWDKVDDTGKKVADIIKKNAANALIKRMVVVDYGFNNGVKMDSEELENINSSMNKYKKEQGEELFNATIASIGVTDVDAYKELYKAETIYNKIKDDFDANRDKYIKDEEEMKQYKDDENVCVKHILIKNDSTKYENPKATAEEVLKKAKAGEDFEKLIAEYNEDPGAKESGYSFGHGEMVPEFEAASFALDYDEISDIVETSYGYHIIKRYVGLAEFENYIVEQKNIIKNMEYIDNLSIKEVLLKISEANKLLAGQNK